MASVSQLERCNNYNKTYLIVNEFSPWIESTIHSISFTFLSPRATSIVRVRCCVRRRSWTVASSSLPMMSLLVSGESIHLLGTVIWRVWLVLTCLDQTLRRGLQNEESGLNFAHFWCLLGWVVVVGTLLIVKLWIECNQSDIVMLRHESDWQAA